MWGILGACFLLFLFAGIPIALVMYMAAALGITAFAGFDPTILVQQLFSGLDSFTSLAVPLFIISGGIAANGGTSRSLIDVIQVIFGRFRGSLAISTVVASAFFAAITGTTLATIVAIGAIMIPALLKAGYPKKFACGIVCAGGTLGILIPPSVPMVNLSVAMGSSVAKQFTAGFVPGVLLALIWCVMVVFYCRKTKIDDRKYYTRAESVKAFKNGILAILYPVIVLGSIYGGFATPTEAAVISIVYVSLVELFFYKSIKLPDLLRSAGQAAVTGGGILMLVAGAKAISWFVAANQIPAAVASFISANISSRFVFLILLIVIFLVLGMFLDIIPLTYILGPILATTLTNFGVDFAQFGIICILCCQLGNLTPPFGMCLFMTMGVAKESLPNVAKGAVPFIVSMAAFALVCAFVPQISMWLPRLLGFT